MARSATSLFFILNHACIQLTGAEDAGIANSNIEDLTAMSLYAL
ncbi:hypothetical protein [Cerasicoccus fimbriatus]|nr:hypothetical protein [Cerasicoccus sp. TK19100]